MRPFPLPRFLSIVCPYILATGLLCAYQQDFLDVTTSITSSPSPQVSFSWDTQKTGVSIQVSRRLMGKEGGTATWEPRGTVAHPATTFTDSLETGVVYEYSISRPAGTDIKLVSAFVAVALTPPVTHIRGRLILAVDKTMVTPLANELRQLENDLAGDGWTVLRLDYDRHGTGTPAGLKAAIQQIYSADPTNTKALYLFGRLPIVKSGYIDPDGHGSLPRATDGYYAEFDGVWSDTRTRGTSNLPGDGILDPDIFPANLKLMTGRVDMALMTAFNKNEANLLRDYIFKTHSYRTGRRTELPWRSLNNTDAWLWQERNWLTAMMGGPANMTYQPFQPVLSTDPHIFGIAFGNYDGAAADYVSKPNKLIFGENFGSGKLNWDGENNAMRSLLTQPDWGLSCVWGARPAWFFHHMGAGYPLGYSALRTMNNVSGPMNTVYNTNYYPMAAFEANYVHLTLMGDPSLRLDAVAPPRNVRTQRIGGAAALEWDPSPDAGVTGYFVYRASSRLGPYTCLNTEEPATGTIFPDVIAPFGELYYQVRAVKTIAHPAAIYPVTSQGAFGILKADGTTNHAPVTDNLTKNVPADAVTPIVLAGNDEDGDALFPLITRNPSNGRLVNNGNQMVYVPNTGFKGIDSFEFTLSDGLAESEAKTATLTVKNGPLLAWEFEEPANNVSPNLNSTSNVPGIAPAKISLGSLSGFKLRITDAYLQIDGLCLNGVSQPQRNATCYLEWTVAPESGATFSLSQVGLGLSSQPVANFNAELHWSVDGFATSTPVLFGNTAKMTVNATGSKPQAGMPFAADLSSFATLQNRTAPVTFRLYLWFDSNRGNAGIGKLGLDANDLMITGMVQLPSGYTDWQSTINWDGSDSSQDADPDGDGLSNMLEFLMGKDPLHPDPTYLAVKPVEEYGARYLAVDFTRRISDRDLLTAQTSSNLEYWSDQSADGVNLLEEILETDGVLETVRYKLLLSEGTTRKFLRLRTP